MTLAEMKISFDSELVTSNNIISNKKLSSIIQSHLKSQSDRSFENSSVNLKRQELNFSQMNLRSTHKVSDGC